MDKQLVYVASDASIMTVIINALPVIMIAIFIVAIVIIIKYFRKLGKDVGIIKKIVEIK